MGATSIMLDQYIEAKVAESEIDWIGLRQLLGYSSRIDDLTRNSDSKANTLALVAAMLRRGFQAVDLRIADQSDRMIAVPWPDQSPAMVLDRIDREWSALGRDPNLWEVCWFDLPQAAR